MLGGSAGRLKMQASMEYSLVNGWSLLAVAIALGILVYYGVFSSNNYSSNVCVADTGYTCANPILVGDGNLSVTMSQLNGHEITITQLGCSSNLTTAPATYQILPIKLQPSQTASMMFQCPLNTSVIGTRFSGSLWIVYSQGAKSGIVSRIGTVDTMVQRVIIQPIVHYAYVALSNNTLAVIDTDSGNVVSDIPVGADPRSISFSPDGSTLYVASYGDNTITVINNKTNSVTSVIPVGAGPSGIAISPFGTYAFVSNYGSGTVSVIDMISDAVVNTVSVGPNPVGIGMSMNGSYVYVANSGGGSGNTVSIINATTYQTVNTVTVSTASGPYSLSVAPDGGYVYVSIEGAQEVSVIGAGSFAVSSTIAVGKDPKYVEFASNNYAFVANSGDSTISVINGISGKVIKTVNVPSGPVGIATTGGGSRIYVADGGASKISIINGTSYAVIRNITLKSAPLAIAVHP